PLNPQSRPHDVIAPANSGMIQRGNPTCLLPKARARRACQDLEGDDAIQACVAGLVVLADATGPNRRENLVGPEARTIGEKHTALNDSISHNAKQTRF